MQNNAGQNNSSQHDKLNKEIAVFVRSAQSGDEQAFGRLYDIYFDRIYAKPNPSADGCILFPETR
jgi:hypothetical protein